MSSKPNKSGFIPQYPASLPLTKPKYSNKWKVSREDFAWDLASLLWTDHLVYNASMVRTRYSGGDGMGHLGMAMGWQYASNIKNWDALHRVRDELNPLRQLSQEQIQLIGDIFEYKVPLFGDHGYLVIDISNKERNEFSRFRSKFRSLSWASIMWLKPHYVITPELAEGLKIIK